MQLHAMHSSLQMWNIKLRHGALWLWRLHHIWRLTPVVSTRLQMQDLWAYRAETVAFQSN